MVELRASDYLKALEQVVPQGLETAKRARVIIQSVCKFAMNTGAIEADPSTTLKDALEAPKVRHFSAPTDPREVGEILRALEASKVAGEVVQCALMLHPLVAVRPGELERARWADFDFEVKEWRFIASKMHQPHFVPLSRRAGGERPAKLGVTRL